MTVKRARGALFVAQEVLVRVRLDTTVLRILPIKRCFHPSPAKRHLLLHLQRALVIVSTSTAQENLRLERLVIAQEDSTTILHRLQRTTSPLPVVRLIQLVPIP
jgi:hypothetical protein